MLKILKFLISLLASVNMFCWILILYMLFVLLVPGCASLHDTTWDIEPKKHVRPEDKPANELTPKEVSSLKLECPWAFIPALPALSEVPDPNAKPVAPERVWGVWRHESDEREQLKLPIIIFEFDPDAHP